MPVAITQAADHGHLNAGAVGTNQGDPLIFDNGADFATSYGYIKTLIYTNSGKYAGFFQGNITLTALAATADHAGPALNAPALGSFIQAQLVSVDGPAGGAFAFWENGATTPAISLNCGATGTAMAMWKLTESDGSPGSDPYGHFHGRRFTATKPGVYTIGFKLFDTSTNGVGGGPIHTPSEVIQVYFQAGFNITSIQKTRNIATVTYGSMAGRNFAVEYTTNLFNPTWTAIGPVATGNDLLQSQSDNNATETKRFYRLNVTTPTQ